MAQSLSAVAIALAVPLIVQFEGFCARPYLCPAGKWTIGYGATHYPNGSHVGPDGAEITEPQARDYLAAELRRIDGNLAKDRAFTRVPSANQNAAMLSLAYNTGSGAFASSTLLEKFNAGDASAADQFLAWDKAHVNGVLTVLPGLIRRRAAERQLFLGAGQ